MSIEYLQACLCAHLPPFPHPLLLLLEQEMGRKSSDDEPFSGLAFKIMTDPFVGSLTFVRVYSGVLEVRRGVWGSLLCAPCLLQADSGVANACWAFRMGAEQQNSNVFTDCRLAATR